MGMGWPLTVTCTRLGLAITPGSSAETYTLTTSCAEAKCRASYGTPLMLVTLRIVGGGTSISTSIGLAASTPLLSLRVAMPVGKFAGMKKLICVGRTPLG